ncbi:MAG: hypothetical protein MHM6MM_006533 [Cercozoa sp. M6MM]
MASAELVMTGAPGDVVQHCLVALPQSLAEAQKIYTCVIQHGNERVKDWPLMNPLHVLALIGGYLALILLLRVLMSFRSSGFKLRWPMVLHNVFLFALSLYMAVEIMTQAMRNNYSWFGNAVDNSEAGHGMARILYIYFLSKVPEFGDTVFMALKKNFHQISFLHVYHHSSIFFVWWMVVFFAPGGESYFSAFLNSGIHVIMYAYYGWSAFLSATDYYAKRGGKPKRPTWKDPAFYRQFITSSQLTQFFTMVGQAVYDMRNPTYAFSTCAVPACVVHLMDACHVQ